MKQHITEKQFKELSNKGRNLLIEWCVKRSLGTEWYHTGLKRKMFSFDCKCQYPESDVGFPELSIGQMIEFLNQKGRYFKSLSYEFPFGWQVWHTKDGDFNNAMSKRNIGKQLCDALWEAVKEVLEKDQL